jgi:hypothetical protein
MEAVRHFLKKYRQTIWPNNSGESDTETEMMTESSDSSDDGNNYSVKMTYQGSNSTKYPVDSIVYSVVKQFMERAEAGRRKYRTDLDRTDLSMLDWIQHAQEEHCDAILYLEKLKQTYMDTRNDPTPSENDSTQSDDI